MRSLARAMILAGLGATLAACASSQTNTAPGLGQPRTTLVVRNDNYLDHTIYLLNGAERVRLGIASGLTTTKFTIPTQYVFGVSSLQFLADPIGSRYSPVSEKINVSAGDEIVLRIPGY